jgi:glycosyltransferase involved in cell wall biosynthesis
MAVSDDLAGWAAELAGVTATVVPMPVSLDRAPIPTAPPSDGPVLAVGRLVPEKGFDVLIQAAAEAGVRVELVGSGDQEQELRALAARVGAEVTFLGALAPAELAARYAAARVIAVPSRREGFGLVAAEAAAAGRAVIASAVGGLPSIVLEGVNGALVPAGDVGALARALCETDPALGGSGPAAVAHLHPDRIGAATAALYATLIHKAPAPDGVASHRG